MRSEIKIPIQKYPRCQQGCRFSGNRITVPSWLRMVIVVLLFSSCEEKAPDCLQTAGDRVSEMVSVPNFDAITVFENIQLVVAQGPVQQVVIETGKNLRPEVTARVSDGVLILRDENNCNLFRDYGETVIRVTTPELSEIRSSTGWPITSSGSLGFSNLRLISESFNNPETATTDGTFDLELDCETVRVVVNGIASVKLRGEADLAVLNVAAGDSRIDTRDLRATTVRINHRGSNDMLVNPQQRIEGVIRGYGDVRSFFRPEEIAVEEQFRGKLIFEVP